MCSEIDNSAVLNLRDAVANIRGYQNSDVGTSPASGRSERRPARFVSSFSGQVVSRSRVGLGDGSRVGTARASRGFRWPRKCSSLPNSNANSTLCTECPAAAANHCGMFLINGMSAPANRTDVNRPGASDTVSTCSMNARERRFLTEAMRGIHRWGSARIIGSRYSMISVVRNLMHRESMSRTRLIPTDAGCISNGRVAQVIVKATKR